jgi:hypothetical protein
LPSLSPSPAPSLGPTVRPSPEPSPSPSASQGPTGTAAPSAAAPADAPTLAPAEAALAAVQLPEIAFTLHVVLPDQRRRRWLQQEDEPDDEVGPLLEGIHYFLQEFLSTGKYRDSFHHVSETARVDGTTVRAQSWSYFTTDSVFDEAVPTEEELGSLLTNYFGFWGQDKLREHLEKAGIDVEAIEDVRLDDSAIAPIQEGGAARSATSSGGGGGLSSGALAGVVIAGAACLAVVAAALVVRRHRKRSSDRELAAADGDIVTVTESGPAAAQPPKKEVDRIDPVVEDTAERDAKDGKALLAGLSFTPTTTAQSTPERGGSNRQPDDEEEPGRIGAAPSPYKRGRDDASLQSIGESSEGDIITLDGSWTGSLASGSAKLAPPGNFKYDAKRLDKVISSAKGYTKDLDSEEPKTIS